MYNPVEFISTQYCHLSPREQNRVKRCNAILHMQIRNQWSK